jgi:outer membrane receptor protein involved in Fe transport
MKNRILLGLTLLLLCGVFAFAQSVAGLGAISGTVRDASGAAVPNAQVVVANESKGIRRSLTTTEAGVFTAPSLVPATGYSVTVNSQGFNAYEAKDIQVLVGQNVNLEVELGVAGTTTQVQVEATAPIVDSTKTDVSQVVGTIQIQDLPINGRRVDSFVLLAPAVVADGTFGLVSFRGIAGGNAFLTDGNDTTNQYYNENAGRTRIQSQIGQDAVQEFQVVSNNYSAEFGHAMGGVVNTVTRSGSNDFHGTGYWFFRNQDFNATDPFASIDPATGKRINPPERRNQLGGSAGGKIIKDKLFYFVNYEALRRDFPLIASITAPGSSLFNTSGQLIAKCPDPSTPLIAPTAAQCQAATDFLQRDFQTLPRSVTQDLGFAKIDWRPSERNAISISLNVLRWVSPNGLQTQAVLNNGNGVGNNVNSSVRDKFGRVAWTSIPTPTMVNEFRFGWFNDKQYDYPNDALAIPGIGFLGIGITGQSNLGTATDYPRKNPLENRYQIADTLSWSRGKHSLKFGFDFLRTRELTDLLFNRTGTYTFPNFAALAADLTGNTAGAKDWSSFTQTIGNPVVDFSIKDYAFFVQDQYKITPRLTLNLGVRYDYSDLPQPTITNPDYPATGRIPTFKGEIAPRIGFAYSLDDQSKTVVRAGYGIFYGRYPGGLINTLFLGNGVYQKSISLNGSSAADRAAGPVFPTVLPTNSTSFTPPAGSVSLNIAANDFRAPYTQQADLAIERQLTRDMALTVSGIWSRGLHLTSVDDINIGAPGPVVTYRINDTGGNQVGSYSTPVYVRQNRVDPRYSRVNIVDAGLNSWYNGLTAQLTKRYAYGITGSASYTWSHAIDEGQGNAGTPNIFASGGPQSYIPGDYRGEKGTSALDVRHRLVINAIWSPMFTHSDNAFAKFLLNGWGLSGLGTLQSAPASTPVVSLTSAFVPTGYTVAFTGSTLNGYGGSTRVPFQALNSVPIAPITRVDLRITKAVAFHERYRAMFTFDAFNVANHTYFTSVSTREYTYSLISGVPTLVPATGFGVGSATQGFPDGTNARRMQLGLRFIW